MSNSKLNSVKEKVKEKGWTIEEEKGVANGTQLVLSNKAKIICYDNGRILVQGPNDIRVIVDKIMDDVRGVADSSLKAIKKVFVVYGHDDHARIALENILRRWGLEPLVLSDLPSEGQTLIEKLEKYTEEAHYGIVLATPDDEGYKAGREGEKKYRARQNVVLELGVLLAKLGRKRVAIIFKEYGENKDMSFEKPSDIHGLVYIRYENSMDDVKIPLAKELANLGCRIPTEML